MPPFPTILNSTHTVICQLPCHYIVDVKHLALRLKQGRAAYTSLCEMWISLCLQKLHNTAAGGAEPSKVGGVAQEQMISSQGHTWERPGDTGM